MKKLFSVALGILTAIGGFVDIGDLVTNAQVGARFGWSLGLGRRWSAWSASACSPRCPAGSRPSADGRPSTSCASGSGRASGLLNLLGSMAVTLLTFIAEIGGVALALQLIVVGPLPAARPARRACSCG